MDEWCILIVLTNNCQIEREATLALQTRYNCKLAQELLDREEQVVLMVLLAMHDFDTIGIITNFEIDITIAEIEEALLVKSQAPPPSKAEIVECVSQLNQSSLEDRNILEKLIYHYFHSSDFWEKIIQFSDQFKAL